MARKKPATTDKATAGTTPVDTTTGDQPAGGPNTHEEEQPATPQVQGESEPAGKEDVPLSERVMPSFGGLPLTARDLSFLFMGMHIGLEVVARFTWVDRLTYLGKVLHRKTSTPPDLLHRVGQHVIKATIDAANVRQPDGELIRDYPPADLFDDVNAFGNLVDARIDKALAEEERKRQEQASRIISATSQDVPLGTVPFKTRRH